MKIFKKITSVCIAVSFTVMTVCPVNIASAQSISQILPQGAISPSVHTFNPVMIEGIKLYANDPLKFDFIINTGDAKLDQKTSQEEVLKLSRYFLAALTVPQDQMWVNLSPYEKDRIVPDMLGKTEMGRDMLAQDYLLKQMTSTLISPENEYGRKFWDRIYKEAQERFGTTDLPTNSFSKVWIIPDQAKIYSHNNTVYVASSHLKVMQQNDYQALSQKLGVQETGISSEQQNMDAVSSKIFQEIMIPQLEYEVNNGEHFAPLRQIFRSLIFAVWYKNALQQTLLGRQYVNQQKIDGVSSSKEDIQTIYQQYVKAFESGVANMITDEYDPTTQQMVPKQYFTGGENFAKTQVNLASLVEIGEHQNNLVQAVNRAQMAASTVELKVSEGLVADGQTQLGDFGYQGAVYNPNFGLLSIKGLVKKDNLETPHDLNLQTRDMTPSEMSEEAKVLKWAHEKKHYSSRDFRHVRVLVLDDASYQWDVLALPVGDTLFVREDFLASIISDPDNTLMFVSVLALQKQRLPNLKQALNDFVVSQRKRAERHYQPVIDVLAEILGGKALTADPTIIGGNQEQPFQLVFHPDQEGVNTLHQTSRLNATTLAFANPELGVTVVGTPHPYGVKIVHMTAVFDAQTDKTGADVMAALKERLADAGYRFEQQIATVQLTPEKKNVIDDKSFAVKQTDAGVQVDFYLWYNDGSSYRAPANYGDAYYPEVQGSLVEQSRVKHPELSRKIRVAINGSAGRIGKPLLYTILRYLRSDIELVAVNGTDADRLIRGADFDSTHQGLLRPGETAIKGKDDVGDYVEFNLLNDENVIEIHKVYAFNDRSLGADRKPTVVNLPWARLNIDIAVEATGAFTTPEQLNQHITAGAKRVLLTAPSKPDESGDKVNPFVIGVNSEDIIKGKLCDGASCTTNSTGAAYKVFLRGLRENAFSFGLDEEQGVGAYFKRLIGLSVTFIAGSLLTIHAITNTQPAFDNTNSSNAEKMYAAFSNFILSSTGAAKALGPLLAELKGRIFANSIRVPNVTNGSLTVTKDIISVTEGEELTPEIVNQRFVMAANSPDYYGVIAVKPGMASSSQILGRSEAGIIAPEATRVTFLKNENGKDIYLVVTAKWYDNEWGYTQRIADALFAMGEQLIEEEKSNAAMLDYNIQFALDEIVKQALSNVKAGETPKIVVPESRKDIEEFLSSGRANPLLQRALDKIEDNDHLFALIQAYLEGKGWETNINQSKDTYPKTFTLKPEFDSASLNGGVNFNAAFFNGNANLKDIPVPFGSPDVEKMNIQGGLVPVLINYQVITSPMTLGLGDGHSSEEESQDWSLHNPVFDRMEEYV